MTTPITNNSTRALSPHPLNGGVPAEKSTTEAPTSWGSAQKSQSTGIPGIVRSRRAKSPEHLPPAMIERIKKAQVDAGVRKPASMEMQTAEPLPLTSGASRQQTWGEWMASWFDESGAPEVSAPLTSEPVAQPANADTPDVTDKSVSKSFRHGILTLKTDMPPGFPANHAKNQKPWVDVLKRFFGEAGVHVMSPPPGYPFPRNLMSSAPDGTVLTSEIVGRSQISKDAPAMRDALEDYCRKLGLDVRRLKKQVNFANVEHVELKNSERALIVATSDYDDLHDEAELRRAFGNPEHVLRIKLDLRPMHGDNPRCYDLDLAFFVAMNDKGEPVALLHKDCVLGGQPNTLGPDEFERALRERGFHVVEVSEEEQLQLVTNSVINPDAPGKMLFTRDDAPSSLVARLAAVGVEAVLPESKRLIGYNEKKGPYSLFGLHCLTVNLRIPIDDQEVDKVDL